MSGNEQENPPKVLKIYSWKLSATKAFDSETELPILRDNTPVELAEWLWEPGGSAQNAAIFEIMAHGLPRKAAEVARALVASHPIVEKTIRTDFGEVADTLLKVPLENIPKDPVEFAPNVRIEYVE